MASLPPFPPELLRAIVAEVRSTADLLQLRATNSTLNALATPLAFKSVCLENRNKSIGYFKTLVKSRFAPYVREVIFQYLEEDTDEESEPSIHVLQLRGQGGQGFIEALYNITHLPALESLVLNFRQDDGPFKSDAGDDPLERAFPGSVMLQTLVFSALGDQRRGSLQPLKSLTIDKYLPLPNPSLTSGSPGIRALLGNLNHLAIKTTTKCAALPSTDPQLEGFGSPLFEKAVVPASLVSLELHHASVRSAGRTIAIEEIHLPRLERLSLQRTFFSAPEGGKMEDQLEDFIVRHGRTLLELEIFLCPMALCTSLQGEQLSHLRRWEQVWEHLNIELRMLRNLVVSERHDSKGVEDAEVPRYVDNCFHCNEVELAEAEIVEDESALRRFRETVESRSPQ